MKDQIQENLRLMWEAALEAKISIDQSKKKLNNLLAVHKQLNEPIKSSHIKILQFLGNAMNELMDEVEISQIAYSNYQLEAEIVKTDCLLKTVNDHLQSESGEGQIWEGAGHE